MYHSQFTSEIKFVISDATAARMREWARTHLYSDPNAIGSDGAYATTTLYFDTPSFDLFFRRGSNARAKFRIRRYNGGPTVFLERKLKSGSHVTKRRLETSAGNLTRIDGRSHWPGSWFARRLQHRSLQPVCQIAYERNAYVGTSISGLLRLTIDRRLTALPVQSVAFANTPGMDILPCQTILELKFGAHMPDLFKQFTEKFRLSPTPVSKYRIAVQALGLAPDSDVIRGWIDGSQAAGLRHANLLKQGETL